MTPHVKIYNDVGEELSDEDVRDIVDKLRKMVKDDDRLSKVRTDDVYLLRFLHASNFNLDEALLRIQKLHDMLLSHPEWFCTKGPLDYTHCLEKHTKFLLEGRDLEGRSIYLTKIGNIDPSKISLMEIVYMDDLWVECILDDPLTQSKGIAMLIDVAGTSWKLMKWMTPLNVYLGIKKLDVLPFKEVVFHVVNTTFVMNAALKIIWPFLSTKLKNQVKFHYYDMNSLHKHISPEVLPEEYGGTSSIDFDKLLQGLYSRDVEIRERLSHNVLK